MYLCCALAVLVPADPVRGVMLARYCRVGAVGMPAPLLLQLGKRTLTHTAGYNGPVSRGSMVCSCLHFTVAGL